ncbi:hypothetical protein HPB50_011214 [Hyalomma asiaticum]|uniref:Uncharacterized protein n=1 Tax=Hyalomma asiaticum TaxID=266040 RepID=A0ACB7T151_HYAAI|nr:hypothetical protein HPB50_011214 [Hyalomma asiaticum]
MAVNDADDDADEEKPREVPTTTEACNVLRLLRNEAECSGDDQRLMRCVEQLENAFLGPNASAKQASIMPFLNLAATAGWDSEAVSASRQARSPSGPVTCAAESRSSAPSQEPQLVCRLRGCWPHIIKLDSVPCASGHVQSATIYTGTCNKAAGLPLGEDVRDGRLPIALFLLRFCHGLSFHKSERKRHVRVFSDAI